MFAKSFGKGTAQNMMPLALNPRLSVTNQMPDNGDGYLKVTTDKFYRVTGSTHQNTGIIPDVAVPDPLEAFNFGEHRLHHSLPADSINKKTYYKPLAKLPLESLSTKSAERQRADSSFQKIQNTLQLIVDLKKKELTMPLDLKGNIAYERRDMERFATLSETRSVDTTLFTINTHGSENRINEFDQTSERLKNDMIDQIRHDLYIEEAWRVMADFIRISQNK